MFEEGWQLLEAGSPRKTEDTQENTQNGTHEKVCEEECLEKGEKE